VVSSTAELSSAALESLLWTVRRADLHDEPTLLIVAIIETVRNPSAVPVVS
jgi:hypothetical protein